MVEGAVRPEERVKICPGRHRWSSLQGNVFQNFIAAGIALVIKPLRCLFERIEHGQVRWRCGVLCGVEPHCKRPRASIVASRGPPAAADRWNPRQVVMKSREMIQSVRKPDETGFECTQIGGFKRKRLHEVLDLPNRICRRVVLDEFTGKPAANRIDGAMRDLQNRPPGGFKRYTSSRLGEG